MAVLVTGCASRGDGVNATESTTTSAPSRRTTDAETTTTAEVASAADSAADGAAAWTWTPTGDVAADAYAESAVVAGELVGVDLVISGTPNNQGQLAILDRSTGETVTTEPPFLGGVDTMGPAELGSGQVGLAVTRYVVTEADGLSADSERYELDVWDPTGTQKVYEWIGEAGDNSYGVHGSVHVIDNDSGVRGVDVGTGDEVWSMPGKAVNKGLTELSWSVLEIWDRDGGGPLALHHAMTGDLISTEVSGRGFDVVSSTETGDLWLKYLDDGRLQPIGDDFEGPVLPDGVMVEGADGSVGVALLSDPNGLGTTSDGLTGWDARTGEVIWNRPLDGVEVYHRATRQGHAVIESGRSQFVVVDLRTGDDVWVSPEDGSRTIEPLYSETRVVDGFLVTTASGDVTLWKAGELFPVGVGADGTVVFAR